MRSQEQWGMSTMWLVSTNLSHHTESLTECQSASSQISSLVWFLVFYILRLRDINNKNQELKWFRLLLPLSVINQFISSCHSPDLFVQHCYLFPIFKFSFFYRTKNNGNISHKQLSTLLEVAPNVELSTADAATLYAHAQQLKRPIKLLLELT